MPSKIKFFGLKDFLLEFSKMGRKMNLRIITRNRAAYPRTGFLTKPNSKPYDSYGMTLRGHAESVGVKESTQN